jgi:hypothetical protein
MPQNAKIDALRITIDGFLDPSLLSAVNRAEKILDEFGVSTKTRSAAMSRIYSTAFGGVGGAIEKAGEKASAFNGVIGRIAEIGAGVGIGDLISQGFNLAVNSAKELVGVMEDAVSKAADFRRTQEQLLVETGGSFKEIQDLTDKLQFAATKSPFMLAPLTEATRNLLSLGGLTTEQSQTLLHQEMNVAAATVHAGQDASQHLLEMNEAVAKALAGGHLMERSMYMLEDAGVKIRPWLEAQMGMTPGVEGSEAEDENRSALYKMIRKGEIESSVILKFFEAQTKEGAKYSDQAVAPFVRDFKGAESTFEDMAAFFERGLGGAIMAPLTKLINQINDSFTFEKFQAVEKFFNELSARSEKIFQPVLDAFAKADWSKVGDSFVDVLDELGKFFEKMMPLMVSTVQELPPFVDALLKITYGIEAVAVAIEKAFAWSINLKPIQIPTTTTDADAVFKAQDKLNALVSAGASDADIQKAKDDLIAAQTAQTNAVSAGTTSLAMFNHMVDKVSGNDLTHLAAAVDLSTAMFNALNKAMGTFAPGVNFGLHGGFSDSPGHDSTYFEYDDEGHSSQYGPKNNRLGDDYGIGLSDYNLQSHPMGSWVKVRAPNGKVFWRQVNERASRDVEFHTKHGGEAEYGEGKTQIIDSSKTKPDGVSINYNPVFHIVGETDHIRKILRDHSEEIADHVRRAFAADYAREAAV